MLRLRDYTLHVIAPYGVSLGSVRAPEPSQLAALREDYEIDYFLTGRIQGNREQIAISVRLTDAESLVAIWSDSRTIDRGVQSLEASEEAIALDIVNAMAVP